MPVGNQRNQLETRTRGGATSGRNIEQNYRMSSWHMGALLLVVLYTAVASLVAARANPISISGAESSGLNQNHQPMRAIHYQFDQKMEPNLQLVKFEPPLLQAGDDEGGRQTGSGNNATCNDGSPAGYYKRLNNHSKSWIIYLQGGGFCGSEEACQHRWSRSGQLMTSNFWQEQISVDGILSSEPKDNPYLWNANHIYVPYCSSDSWTGQREAGKSSSFAFMGSKIIERVLESLFDDLPRDSSLHEAKFILLAGDSAGATGVMMNLDKVNRLVQQRFATATHAGSPGCAPGGLALCEPCQVPIVRGIADSGWFLDNEPYDVYQEEQQATSGGYVGGQDQVVPPPPEPTDCVRQRCSPLQSIRQAMGLWDGQAPAACAARHPGEPWRCYFGYRAYPSLRTPLFVVQWLYDEAQLMVDNIIRPGTNSQWNYVNRLVGELRASLENVTALFAPSCLSHSLITKQSWNQININGFKLPHILNSWEEETLASQPSLELLLRDERQQRFVVANTVASAYQQSSIINGNQVTPASHNQLFDRLIALQQHRETAPANQQQPYEMRRSLAASAATVAPGTNSRSRSRKKRRNNNNNNNNNSGQQSQTRANNISRLSRSTVVEESTVVLNNNVPEVLGSAQGKSQEGLDKFRLIDTCGWPQCNRDCPSMELDFGLRPMLAY